MRLGLAPTDSVDVADDVSLDVAVMEPVADALLDAVPLLLGVLLGVTELLAVLLRVADAENLRFSNRPRWASASHSQSAPAW